MVRDEHHIMFECANFHHNFEANGISKVWKVENVFRFINDISKSEILRL